MYSNNRFSENFQFTENYFNNYAYHAKCESVLVRWNFFELKQRKIIIVK